MTGGEPVPDLTVSLAVAAAGGFAYFLSPCVWPLYPAYLTYLAGSAGVGDGAISSTSFRAVLLKRALGFVVGFSLVFVLLGATASAIGQTLLAYQPLIRRVAGLLITAAGLFMLGWLRVPWLNTERRPLSLRPRSGTLGALTMGIAFSFGWTPCVGPVLAAVLAYASTSATIGRGVVLLVAFAAGLAVPFLLLALLFERFSARWHLWQSRVGVISKIAGGVLGVLGLMVYTNYLSMLAAWLFYAVPGGR